MRANTASLFTRISVANFVHLISFRQKSFIGRVKMARQRRSLCKKKCARFQRAQTKEKNCIGIEDENIQTDA
jgi:hypothetical protein